MIGTLTPNHGKKLGTLTPNHGKILGTQTLKHGILNIIHLCGTHGETLLQPNGTKAMDGMILLTGELLNSSQLVAMLSKPRPSLTPGIQTNGGEPKLEAAAHLPLLPQAHLQALQAAHRVLHPAAHQAALLAAHPQAHHLAQVHPAQAQKNWLKEILMLGPLSHTILPH